MLRNILKGKIVLLICAVTALVFLALVVMQLNVPSSAKGTAAFVFHDKLKKSDMGGGIMRQYLGACDKMNAQHVDLADGSTVKIHTHPQVQLGYVISGGLKVTIGNDTQILKAGDAYFVPAGLPHEPTAIGQTEVVDVFSPIRSDIQ